MLKKLFLYVVIASIIFIFGIGLDISSAETFNAHSELKELPLAIGIEIEMHGIRILVKYTGSKANLKNKFVYMTSDNYDDKVLELENNKKRKPVTDGYVFEDDLITISLDHCKQNKTTKFKNKNIGGTCCPEIVTGPIKSDDIDTLTDANKCIRCFMYAVLGGRDNVNGKAIATKIPDVKGDIELYEIISSTDVNINPAITYKSNKYTKVKSIKIFAWKDIKKWYDDCIDALFTNSDKKELYKNFDLGSFNWYKKRVDTAQLSDVKDFELFIMRISKISNGKSGVQISYGIPIYQLGNAVFRSEISTTYANEDWSPLWTDSWENSRSKAGVCLSRLKITDKYDKDYYKQVHGLLSYLYYPYFLYKNTLTKVKKDDMTWYKKWKKKGEKEDLYFDWSKHVSGSSRCAKSYHVQLIKSPITWIASSLNEHAGLYTSGLCDGMVNNPDECLVSNRSSQNNNFIKDYMHKHICECKDYKMNRGHYQSMYGDYNEKENFHFAEAPGKEIEPFIATINKFKYVSTVVESRPGGLEMNKNFHPFVNENDFVNLCEGVKEVLKLQDMDIDYSENGNNILHKYAELNDKDSMKKVLNVLEKCPDLKNIATLKNGKNGNDKTPLEIATENGYTEIENLLQ